MAKFRKIHTSFWGDEFVANLTPEQKYFYLYLLTNNYTRQCGIYEISKRIICFDTGYNIETVTKLLAYFVDAKKIVLSPETNEIVVLNWLRYNDSTSPKVQQCIKTELKTVKNTLLIQYLYSTDTHPQKEGEKEKEKEGEGEATHRAVFEILKKARPDVGKDELKTTTLKLVKTKPLIDTAKDYDYILEWARRMKGDVTLQTPAETPEQRRARADAEWISENQRLKAKYDA